MIQRIGIFFMACVFSLSTAMAGNTFNSMVIFGDSLSDNGNLYRYMWGYLPSSPPYFEGHFSNGPVWAEYLYRSLYGEENGDRFQDYAVGGAGAVLSYKENLPYTLTIELNNYLYWHKFDDPGQSLFSIWIGANNYLNGPTNIDELTTGVVEAIGTVIERIIERGGDKFLVGNLPDLGHLPQAKINGTESLLRELTEVHNDKLARKIAQLQARYPAVTVVYIDAHAFFEQALVQPERYDLKNISEACYEGSYSGWFQSMQFSPDVLYSHSRESNKPISAGEWKAIVDNPQLFEAAKVGSVFRALPAYLQDVPPDCTGYLFWDHVHPTTQVHKLIAEQVHKRIKQAGLQAVIHEPKSLENPDGGPFLARGRQQNTEEATGRSAAISRCAFSRIVC